METSALLALGLSLLSKVAGNAINSSMSRGDFAYSHGMTNIPAQVKEMRDAGLNPALMYGQVSAPQGQSLGNYQSDFLQGMKDLQNSEEARANTEYRKAETDLLKKQAEYIVQKTKNEAALSTFDVNHQQERYDLEIAGKGLVNAGQEIKNEGYQLDNKGKLIQNEIAGIQRDIAEFDRSMKSIDARYHEDYVKAEYKRICSNIFLTISEANALRRKLPYELANMNALTQKYKAEKTESVRRAYAQQLANEMEEYLRKNGLHNRYMANADMLNLVGMIMQTLSDLDIGFGW